VFMLRLCTTKERRRRSLATNLPRLTEHLAD
jgi:hypothetical protein